MFQCQAQSHAEEIHGLVVVVGVEARVVTLSSRYANAGRSCWAESCQASSKNCSFLAGIPWASMSAWIRLLPTTRPDSLPQPYLAKMPPTPEKQRTRSNSRCHRSLNGEDDGTRTRNHRIDSPVL